MTYPVNEEEAREFLSNGQKMKTFRLNRGYVEVFKPVVERMLEDADAKCHNYKMRADRGKEAIVEWNTIRKIMDICANYITNYEHAVEYCRDNDIKY